MPLQVVGIIHVSGGLRERLGFFAIFLPVCHCTDCWSSLWLALALDHPADCVATTTLTGCGPFFLGGAAAAECQELCPAWQSATEVKTIVDCIGRLRGSG